MKCEGRAFNIQLASPVSHVVIDAVLPTVLLRAGGGNYALVIADDISLEEGWPVKHEYMINAAANRYGVVGDDVRLKWKRKGPKKRGR